MSIGFGRGRLRVVRDVCFIKAKAVPVWCPARREQHALGADLFLLPSRSMVRTTSLSTCSMRQTALVEMVGTGWSAGNSTAVRDPATSQSLFVVTWP